MGSSSCWERRQKRREEYSRLLREVLEKKFPTQGSGQACKPCLEDRILDSQKRRSWFYHSGLAGSFLLPPRFTPYLPANNPPDRQFPPPLMPRKTCKDGFKPRAKGGQCSAPSYASGFSKRSFSAGEGPGRRCPDARRWGLRGRCWEDSLICSPQPIHTGPPERHLFSK